MYLQALLGALGRAVPRGRRPLMSFLERFPGRSEIEYVDVNGHARRADLRDHLERAWFAGVNFGIPDSIVSRIPPRSLTIDVGANIGAVTGQLARRVGPEGQVWAIEPVKRNLSRLTELVELNGLPVKILPVAAGATDGEVTIHLSDSAHSGWASVTASWIRTGADRVILRSLDSLLAEHRPEQPLSFVKIDVEGYEAEVIAGARRTFETFKPLLYVEFNDLILRDRGSSSSELLQLLADTGYEPTKADPSRLRSMDGVVIDLLLEPRGRGSVHGDGSLVA